MLRLAGHRHISIITEGVREAILISKIYLVGMCPRGVSLRTVSQRHDLILAGFEIDGEVAIVSARGMLGKGAHLTTVLIDNEVDGSEIVTDRLTSACVFKGDMQDKVAIRILTGTDFVVDWFFASEHKEEQDK